MNPDDIVSYLLENPDFFIENSELFTQITVSHPQDDQRTISLAERQLHVLREKIRQLEHKLAELIAYGEENDAISEKVHRLSVALMSTKNYGLMQATLYGSLQEDFSVPHIAMRIWQSVLVRDEPEYTPVSELMREQAAELVRPYCGPPENSEVLGWFGEIAPHLRSVAMMPLRLENETFGLLVLGSEDPERFYPEMGTLYLERIADLVAAALLSEIT